MHRYALLLTTVLITSLPLTSCTRPDVPTLGDSVLEARSESGRYRFVITPRPERPAVGELFSVVTHIADVLTEEPVTGARFTLDATMPEHGHGMMTRPLHRELGGGRYLTEGMKLHMHGRWELVGELERERDRQRMRLPLVMPPGAR